MKARLSSLVTALIILLAVLQPVYAQALISGIVNANANLRGGPGTNNAIVGHLTAGATVQIATCNDDCSWYQLSTGEWIAAFLVDTTTAPATTSATTTASAATTLCSQVNATANLRTGPGTSYDRVGSAQAGTCVVITGKSEAEDWFQLDSGNWIAAFLVTNPGSLSAIPVVEASSGVTAAATAPTQTLQPQQPTPIPPTSVPPTATPVPQPTAPACDPNYTGACIPIVEYDLNCPDVGVKDFRSIGSDPHGFDRDSDGIACES